MPQIPSAIRSTNAARPRPDVTEHDRASVNTIVFDPGNDPTRVVQRRSTGIAYGKFQVAGPSGSTRLPPGSKHAATPSSAAVTAKRFL